MFSTHFAGSRPHQTTTISLLGIRQEQNEPLRAFIDRFSKAALRTPHLNQKMILQCMALILQPGPFANNVYLHPPACMHELKLRAADYVRMEEMQTLHTKFCNDYAATPTNPNPHPNPRPDTRSREPRQPRFTRYAPFTVACSRILDEALQADLIPPPRKTTTSPNADMTKYCRYHRNHGHTTDECKALQDKIEELVCASHFRRFIHRDDHSSSSRSRHPLDPLIDVHHMTSVTTGTPPNPPIKNRSRPVPTSPQPTLPYVAPLTPSLVASQAEAPPLLPEKDTSAIYNPSTISPIPTTDAVCPLSSSQMMTSTALTTNKTSPWSSLLKSKITLSRKSLLIKAALSISSIGPPTKNFNSLTPPWSHMTSQYMAFLVNKYPPGATLTSTPSFGREPKLKPSQSASSSSTRQHPITSSWAVVPSIPLAPSFPPLT